VTGATRTQHGGEAEEIIQQKQALCPFLTYLNLMRFRAAN
jgi:hypothetical protein